MNFRLVTNSVTLHDLERCNSPNCRVISQNSVAFGEDPKNLVLAMYHLWRYWQGITFSESVKMRHCALVSKNLTNNQP